MPQFWLQAKIKGHRIVSQLQSCTKVVLVLPGSTPNGNYNVKIVCQGILRDLKVCTTS